MTPAEKALEASVELAAAMAGVAAIRQELRMAPECHNAPEPEVGLFGDTCLNLALKPLEFLVPGAPPDLDARPRTDDEVRAFIGDCAECHARFELIVQLRGAKKARGRARVRVAALGRAELARRKAAAGA